MNRLLLAITLILLAASGLQAQVGSFGDIPIEINAEETRFENGIAIAERDVIIRYAGTTIYCDRARYNPDTRDVLMEGSVRLYRDGQQFSGERALYNLDTKVLNAGDFGGDFSPYEFGGDTLSTLGSNAYLVKSGLFTTSDSSKPDYVIKARTVRIYPHDRIVFQNAKLYIGKVPVFWYPYLSQSLNREQSFTIFPGYQSTLGALLLTQSTFPIAENMTGQVRLDLMSTRGVGVGFNARWREGPETSALDSALIADNEGTGGGDGNKSGKGWGRFESYYLHDLAPGKNDTGLDREPINPNRYRVSLQDRTYWTEDIYSSIDINRLSDRRYLQDFRPGEFRENPNPDNAISLTKWNEDYTVTLTGRAQLNRNFDGTEKMPEGALDIKQQPIFGKSGLFYLGEDSAGLYRRHFATDSGIPGYGTFRADMLHQISYPGTYGGWLSLVPRLALRGTYYEEGLRGHTIYPNVIDPLTGLPQLDANGQNVTTKSTEFRSAGGVFRPTLNTGLEASFKISRAFEDVESRAWGLDGLRHVIQPYMNASFTYTGEKPERILQFDRLNQSTQLAPLDFPQFNTIDSIDNWSIVRLGMRNRLETRRDNSTFDWFELDTFFNINIDRPKFGSVSPLSDTGTFSNLFNRLRWNPLPWVGLQVDSQLPVFDAGFSEVNTSVNFMVTRDVQLNVGDRYIYGNKQFIDSNYLTMGGYLRLGENWGLAASEAYEFSYHTLEFQSYALQRDLSSWVASLGFTVQNNGSSSPEVYGVTLTFTLKDLPGAHIPVAYDPTNVGLGSTKNR